MRYLSMFGLAGLLLAGCSPSYSGTWQAELQLVEGKTENERHPLQATRESWSQGANTTLQLKSNGRYVFTNADFTFEGDWWVTGNDQIAVHRDTQNGNLINPKLQAEVDRYYTIRPDGKLSWPYGREETNLEVVFTRQ